MTTRTASLLLAGVLALGGCATAPALQPGFSEQRIEADRLRLIHRAPPGLDPRIAADQALLRAADLTLAAGYDWFRVVERTDAFEPPRGPRISFGVGGGDYGRRGGVGVGLGTSLPLGGRGTAVVGLEILMGRGERPPGGEAYDARAVRRHLGAAL